MSKRTITPKEREWFLKLNESLSSLPLDKVEEIKGHISYLVNHGSGNIFDENFMAEGDMFADAVTNIIEILGNGSGVPILEERRPLTQGERGVLIEYLQGIRPLPREIYRGVKNCIIYLEESGGASIRDNEFTADNRIIQDTIRAINSLIGNDELTFSLDEIIALSQKELDGWCTDEKCKKIAELILSDKPEIGVEIGIFGGRSLIPAAAAMRCNGFGAMWGIEAWSNKIATEYHTPRIGNDEWWNKLNMVPIKKDFLNFVNKMNLTGWVRILEAPAASVEQVFTEIGYLHIDGAHSVWNAAEDVILYAKKVKTGGLIVIDDVDWVTTGPAVEVLDSIGERIFSLRNENKEINCLFFRKK